MKMVQAAAFECFAQLAGVVAGQQHQRAVHRAERPKLGHAHLEIAQHFQQKCFELGIRPVDLVDQQDGRLLAQDGFQQRALQQKAHREEDIFLLRQPVGGSSQAFDPGKGLLQLIAQQLGVQELLGVFPLVERLGLIQPFVALQADQLAPGGAGDGFGQLGLAYARRAFRQQRFAQLLAEEHDRGDFIAGNILLLC